MTKQNLRYAELYYPTGWQIRCHESVIYIPEAGETQNWCETAVSAQIIYVSRAALLEQRVWHTSHMSCARRMFLLRLLKVPYPCVHQRICTIVWRDDQSPR
jgi:hypothetical protein